MNIVQFRDFCLKKIGATESFPFDNDTLAFKVKGKIFALTSLQSWESGNPQVNLKCDPEKAQHLRDEFPERILPGYHMNKTHWNSVVMANSNLSEKKKFYLVNHSHELVVSKLLKKERTEIKELRKNQ
jgi:predicted DNA-binding protein (MmcQ/YjbR family)